MKNQLFLFLLDISAKSLSLVVFWKKSVFIHPRRRSRRRKKKKPDLAAAVVKKEEGKRTKTENLSGKNTEINTYYRRQITAKKRKQEKVLAIPMILG